MRWSELIESDEWSPQELLDYASPWHVVVPGDPPEAQMPAENYVWRYEPAYPLDRIAEDTGPESWTWAEWMRDEIEMWAEDGQPNRYNDELKNPIREPVVLVEVNGKGWLWDGCHRVGASAMTGRPTIPAVVGTPKKKGG